MTGKTMRISEETTALDNGNTNKNESSRQHLEHGKETVIAFFSTYSSDDDFDTERSDNTNHFPTKENVLKKGEAMFPGGDGDRVQCCLKPIVSYEAFVWVLFTATTALAILDRFTTNVWPRQMFSIGGGSAGNDRLVGFKPGPWSVVAYDVIARVSGRFSICCFNLLLITRLRCLEHALLCSTWVNQILDCTNIIKANLRLHKWNAIALCVLTLIHVWSILFPCLTHKYSAQVIPGTFEWPLSERTPPGFKDADPQTKTMSLQVDDIWRMIEMTILLCVLTPLSVRWLSTRWHVGMPLHQLNSTLYFVDIVRRHTHPHSWVLNTPVFCMWLFDKLWFWYYNRTVSPKMHRVKLGEDYMVLYWNHKESSERNSIVSPDYFLRLKDSSFLESAHVFTCFKNRTQNSQSVLPGGQPFEWTVGSVIRIFRNKRKPKLGAKDPISHTARMYDISSDELNMTAWGPYNSEMSAHLRASLLEQSGTPTTLIGAGSGIGYVIDVLQWRKVHSPNSGLKILFSTRSFDLFRWVKEEVEPFVVDDNTIQVKLALTGKHQKGQIADVEEGSLSNVSIQYRHFAFEREIEDNSTVFCQGGKALNEHIGKICHWKKAKFYGGLQTTERIEMFDALIESIHNSFRSVRNSMSGSIHSLQNIVSR